MAHLTTNLPAVNAFFKTFRPHFSAKQFPMLQDSVLSLFQEYKRCSLQAMAQKIGCDYQQLQYFASDAKWDDIRGMNQDRLSLIERFRPTRPTKNGVSVIDDTGCPKPYAIKTVGAKYQHCPPLHREEVCNVIVFSAYADSKKHFPIDFAPYRPQQEFAAGDADPEFKSKIQIAMEMIAHNARNPLLPKLCVLDSWYTASELIEYAVALGVTVAGELKSNRNIRFFKPDTQREEYVQQDELVKLISARYSHKVSYVQTCTAKGDPRNVPVYSFVSKLKDCKVPVKIVVVLDKLFEEDTAKIRILFSTDIQASAQKIVDQYALRWGIERIFQEIKENFSFDHYQMRSLAHIRRFWFLCILAWTLLYRLKMMGALRKVVRLDSETFPEYVRAVRKLIAFAENRLLSKSDCPHRAFRILSNRMARRAG